MAGTVHTIISGGQTGADKGGLTAGRALGLVTGGWAPQGWRTDTGPAPELASFGLVEHASPAYPQRTEANVLRGDATLLFGYAGSPGARLTSRLCQTHHRPLFFRPWLSDQPVPDAAAFREWLLAHRVGVLNVAGNREAGQPGIEAAVHAFLLTSLGGT